MMTLTHPAMFDLLRLQSRGRTRRIWRRFCQPRRLILSLLACALAIVWLGNAAMTVWLREAGSRPTLVALLSLGLLLYAAWHFAKAAFFRVESPFDWTPAERELLSAMPLRSRDLVSYQLASVTATTCLKAGLLSLLLLPDLHCVPLGALGLLLAMMFLEVLRMTVEIATWGMSRTAFLIYRLMVVAGLLVAGFEIGRVIVRVDSFRGEINVGDGFLARLVDILVQLNASALGYVTAPFRPFVDLILAESLSVANLGLAALGLSIVAVLSGTVIGLHAATTRLVVRRARRLYHERTEVLPARAAADGSLRLSSVPYLQGAGALAWRQLVGARRQWGSLLTAMIAPAVLASAPCFVIADPNVAILVTTGTVAFYTFLLLPTALRFDFRRDLDQLATLKSLPLSPGAVALGEIFAPVLIATLFQCVVLGFAIAARSLPPYYLAVAILTMIPLNVLVFALDNVIFLLYPYRMQQEGVEIFLRTMLTFTGKGLLFSLSLAAISGWGFAAAALTHRFAAWTGTSLDAFSVFSAGMVAGPAFLAAILLYALSRTYHRLDPIEDVPR